MLVCKLLKKFYLHVFFRFLLFVHAILLVTPTVLCYVIRSLNVVLFVSLHKYLEWSTRGQNEYIARWLIESNLPAYAIQSKYSKRFVV